MTSQTTEKQSETRAGLREDFSQRLELTLDNADQERRRLLLLRRARSLLPLLLLIGPIVAWRLILSSPDGVHLGIGALAWLTFLLDVGVHADNSLLRYLGLQTMPAIVGTLLFALVALLLVAARGEE